MIEIKERSKREEEEMIRSPLEQFEIVPLIPMRLGRLDITFTNSSLMMVVSVLLIVMLVKMIGSNGGRLVPSRWQSVVESIYKMVVQMSNESIGAKGGEYIVMIFSLFSMILAMNMLGMIPYSYTVTSQLVVTMTLSMGVWIGKLMVGMRNHGLKLFGMFIPAGAPFAMVPFFVFIEIIGFIIPMISLAVRLFANMMAGHILLKVLFGFAWTMMMGGGIMFIAQFVPLGVLFILLGLETAVGLIQAYVFTLLTCLYIGDMINGGH